MDRFPDTLVPGGELAEMYKAHVLRKLRERVFESVVAGNPDNYVDLSAFEFATYPEFKKLVAAVRSELEGLGWKTALMYGDTALFVFAEGNKPKFW